MAWFVLQITWEGRLSAADLASQFQTVRTAIEHAASQARTAMDEAYELVQPHAVVEVADLQVG